VAETTLRDQLAPYAAPKEGLGEPTEEDLKNPVAAPGRTALLEAGILFQGGWQKRSDGMARHTREAARALALYMPVNLVGTGGQLVLEAQMAPEVIESVGYLRSVHCARYLLAIRHVVLGSREHLHHLVCPASASLVGEALNEAIWNSTVVYTSWECDRVDPALAADLGRAGQVWVPCQQNHDALQSSGVPPEKLRIVPCPYDPATHAPSQIPAPRGSEEVPLGKRFYAIGKWEPRKNYHALIGAFLLAFTPKDRACLTIKTFGWGTWKGYPTPEESGAFWAQSVEVRKRGWTPAKMARLIKIIDDDLTDREIAELHQKNNIYVSCSHGEAWDLPAFDARCAGNSLVYTGYGGAEEYSQDAGPYCVRITYRMEPVHSAYGWPVGAQWAGVSMEDLTSALKWAEPGRLRRHPRDFAGRFGRVAVGALMKRNLVQLLNPEAYQLLEAAGTYG